MNSEEIPAAAAAPPAADRQACPDSACGGSLSGGETVAQAPGDAAQRHQFQSEQSGMRIGRYRLLQQIGEGGFGTVWMAEQVEPVTRRVALKIIKAGMDTKEVIARFEAERQALAMMDHPNIARVLDAGATEQGRPFFVMELVKGIRITKFCDEQEFTMRQRLELFADVCSAINHAHQKGVIHRDIKPSNVMVTLNGDRAVVKVIDFGIAKATQGRLTERTLFTRFEQFVGTPAYMSPEQAAISEVDIDTRSDIYSLGILAYELLTGRPPFDTKSLVSAGYEEMRRIIREVEPPRPSSRLATIAGDERTAVARARRIGPEKLSRMVEPDLDWIVMKAIEKDRTRRYETANGLALDIRRFLADEPVSAGPPTAAYRFRKFARRHRAALRVSAALAAVLVAATAVSTWQAVRAGNAEALASRRVVEVEGARREAESAFRFLTELFQRPDLPADGRAVTFAETLDRAARKLESDPNVPPERKAKLQGTIGWTYQSLGLYKEAVPLLQKSSDFLLAAHGEEHPDTLVAMHNLAWTLFRNGQEDEARKLKERVLPLAARILRPEHVNLLIVMDLVAGPSFTSEAEQKESNRLLESLRAASRSGMENQETLLAMARMALFLDESGNSAESLRLWDRILPLCRKLNGEDNYLTFWAMQGMADAMKGASRRDEAIAIEQDVVRLREKKLGADHPDTLLGMDNLADSLAAAGRREEAIALVEKALALCEKKHGKADALYFKITSNLADFHADAGQPRKSLPLNEAVLAFQKKTHKPDSPAALEAASALARTLTLLGDFDRADSLLADALTAYRKSGKPMDLEVRLKEVAELRFRQKQFAAAEALCRERIESRRARANWETSFTIHDTHLLLGRLLAEWAWHERESGSADVQRRATEAESILREALTANLRDKAGAALHRPDALNRLGWAVSVSALTNPSLSGPARDSKLEEAEKLLLEGIAGMEKEKATTHTMLRDGLDRLVRFYEAWSKPERAAEWKARLAAHDKTAREPEPPASK